MALRNSAMASACRCFCSRAEAALAQRQDLAALDDALNVLPVAWREYLILREVEALSYKEMARIMDIPIGRSCRASRARQALRRDVCGDDSQGFATRNASGSWLPDLGSNQGPAD